MIKLSIVIITFNEERNIARCLESIKEVADEVLVVDSLSTDRTKEICINYGVRFIEQKFLGYVEQKNFALELASYDYVLSLDADEALSPQLLEEIIKVKKNFSSEGYKFNRITNYCDSWIRHCGWYPDTKLRLVKKSAAHWVGTNPHDVLVLKDNQPEIHLDGDLYHYSYYTISEHIRQVNKFAEIEAYSLFKKGKRASIVKLVTRPIYHFFKDYILRLGILDGYRGFIICFIGGIYTLLKYAIMMDLNKQD